jgi:serine/threonine-protein kinase RsbW
MLEDSRTGVGGATATSGTDRPRRKHAPEYKITVASKLENLAKISGFVSQVGAQLKLPADFVFDSQVAVNEACTNIIQHAYGLRADRPISVGCRLRNAEFIIRVRDFGAPFDPDAIAKYKVEGKLGRRTTSGLGLFLMRKLMNRVKFRFEDKRGTELTLMKRLPAPEAAAPAAEGVAADAAQSQAD